MYDSIFTLYQNLDVAEEEAVLGDQGFQY